MSDVERRTRVFSWHSYIIIQKIQCLPYNAKFMQIKIATLGSSGFL
jgi:hypothetical protein